MPLFQVFHHDPTLSRHLAFREDAFKLWPLGYRRVAVVEAPELGAVFELTNHIDSNWTEGPAVVTLDDPRARSTSVGDVILDTRSDYLFGVAGIGFTDMGRLKRCWYCHKPVYDWEVGPDGVSVGMSSCKSCQDARLSMRDWAAAEKDKS